MRTAQWRFIPIMAAALLSSFAAPSFAQQPIPAKPVMQLTRAELYLAGGGTFIRWRFDVANKAAYPPEMFAASPDLPPCGSNKNASRTWVDFFDGNDRRLYGFCALGAPDALGTIWFATPEDQAPPSSVYIVMTDRRTNVRYRSDAVDLRPEALVARAAVRRSAGDRPGAFRLLERAISIRKRTGPVDPAWYDTALSLASSFAPN